jgi:hypothetical protein
MYSSTSFNKERKQKIRVAAGCVGNKTSRRIDIQTEARKKAGHKKREKLVTITITIYRFNNST